MISVKSSQGPSKRWKTHLSLRKSPKINPHSDQIIQSRIRALIQQQRREGRERIQHQPGLDAAMYRGAGDEAEGPFPCQTGKSKDQVHDLEDGDGLDGRVAVLCEEVPEDFGPEEAFEGGGDLV